MYLGILIKALTWYAEEVHHDDDYVKAAIDEALDELLCQQSVMYDCTWNRKVHIITEDNINRIFDVLAYDTFGRVARECLNEGRKPELHTFSNRVRKDIMELRHSNANVMRTAYEYLEDRWWLMEEWGNNAPDGSYNKED